MRFLKSFTDKFYPKDSVLRSFVKGSFWAVYGNVAVKGFSFLASIIITRLLGSTIFGELSIIKTTLSVFSLLASFGLGVTVTKFVAEKRNNNPTELGTFISAANTVTIVSGLFFGCALTIFSNFISTHLLRSPNLIVPLRISAIYLFFNAITVYQVGVISGLGAFKELARINLIVGIITLPVLLVTTYFFGLNGTLSGLSLNLVINWGLNHVLIKAKTIELGVRMNYENLRSQINQILLFSYPLALKEIIYSLSNWACFYLLLIRTNYDQVGVFNSANQLSQLILFLPSSLLSVLLSFLSRQSNDIIGYKTLLKRHILLTLVVTFSIGIVIAMMSGLIYEFYGQSYRGGERVLYILIAATLPMSLVGIFEQVYISNSRPGLITIFQILIQILILSSAFVFFIINSAATSLAFSILTGYSIATLIMYINTKRMGFL